MAGAFQVANLLTKIGVDYKDAQKGTKAYTKFSKKHDAENKKVVKGTKAHTAAVKSNIAAVARMAAPYAIAAAAVAGVTKVLAEGVREFARYESQMLQLNALLRTTGYVSGQTGASLDEMARRFGRSTLASAQGVRDAQAALLTFKNITGGLFEDTIEAALDLSAIMKTDVRSSILQIGKALEDPITNMSNLRRSGISFTDEQKDTIKALYEGNQQLEARRKLLGIIQGQIGGAAAGAASGTAGVLDNLAEEWTELKENIGKAVVEFTPFKSAITATTRLLGGLNAVLRSLPGMGDQAGPEGTPYRVAPLGSAADAAATSRSARIERDKQQGIINRINKENESAWIWETSTATPERRRGQQQEIMNQANAVVRGQDIISQMAGGGQRGRVQEIRDRIGNKRDTDTKSNLKNVQKRAYWNQKILESETEFHEKSWKEQEDFQKRQFELAQEAKERAIEAKAVQDQKELETQAEQNRMKLQQERDYQHALAAVGLDGWRNYSDITMQEASASFQAQMDIFGNAIDQAAQKSKSWFEFSKRLSVAKAIIGSREAAVSAFKVGTELGTPALGAAFAAAALAATGVHIKAIMSQKFQGRRAGGMVKASDMYEVGEGNKPELYRSGGKQYMIPGNNGRVVSNSNMGGNITLNVKIVNKSSQNIEKTRQSISPQGEVIVVIEDALASRYDQGQGNLRRAVTNGRFE